MTTTLLSPRGGLLLAPLLLQLLGPTAAAQDLPTLADLSVYPNPAHIRATVQVPPVAGASSATVTLFDAQGQAVFAQPVSLLDTGGTAEVPLLGRPAGVYRVMVQVGEQRVARPLKVE